MFEDVTGQIREFLWPKKYFAWQTLLMLSLFSVAIAAGIQSLDPENFWAIEIISTLSWVFFTAAIWWWLTDKPIKVNDFSVSPWIVGALICLFLLRPWVDTRFRWALSIWPLLSTGVMALPSFVNWKLEFKPFQKLKNEKQQLLILVLLINLLLSSWIMFYFRIQDWVDNYPSLLASDFNRSAFLYDFAAPDRNRQSQGVPLLKTTANALYGELDKQPWYQTERWLYNLKNNLDSLSPRMLDSLAAKEESVFWRMTVPEPQKYGEGYRLTLRAIWQGPVSQASGFYVEKTCKIMPEDRVRSVPVEKDKPVPTTQITKVECGEDAESVTWIKAEV